MIVLRSGFPAHELPLDELSGEAVIGRHPDADLHLECQGLALTHLLLRKIDDAYYLDSRDTHHLSLLNERTLPCNHPIQLRNGDVVDIPGYRLVFALPEWPHVIDAGSAFPNWGEKPPPASSATHRPLRSRLTARSDFHRPWPEGATTLTVKTIIEETPGSKTFCLVGDDALPFSYKPGQFVTLLLEIDGQSIQRSYSMSSSPSRPHTLELTVQRVPGGFVSNWLCDRLKVGDLLTVKGPSGSFTCFDDPPRKLLFIAAGSGLTPIMSMCRWIVDTAADIDVKLLASFHSAPEILFRKELEWMSARHPAFQVVLTITSGRRRPEGWHGLTGRVHREMISRLAPDIMDRRIFLCGPESFMDRVEQILRDLKFDLSKLHTESFNPLRRAEGATRSKPVLRLATPRHRVKFTRSGLTVDTDESLTLLELAEAHGIELDYSCRSGSCGECEVKCRGSVAMKPECEIDSRQRAAGFVYACCSVAKSDIEIDA